MHSGPTHRRVHLAVAALVILFVGSQRRVFAQMVVLGGTDTRAVASPPGAETGLGPNPVFSHFGPGADFAVSGAATRVLTIPENSPAAEPFFTLEAPAIPAGAIELKTLVVWHFLLLGDPPTTCTIAIDNLGGAGFVPVVGDKVGAGGSDLCWVKDGTVTYLADVTGLGVVALGAPNNISAATDRALGTDTDAYGDGLTILVAYEVPGEPLRTVDVYAGYTSTESGIDGEAGATLALSNTYVGGELHFFLNALDGQLNGGVDGPFFADTFEINGNEAFAFAGGVLIDAWQGRLPATAPAAGPPPDENWLYDHAEGDASLYVTAPADEIAAMTTRNLPGDCVGHSLAAASFAAFPGVEIPAMSAGGFAATAVAVLVIGSAVMKRRDRALKGTARTNI